MTLLTDRRTVGTARSTTPVPTGSPGCRLPVAGRRSSGGPADRPARSCLRPRVAMSVGSPCGPPGRPVRRLRPPVIESRSVTSCRAESAAPRRRLRDSVARTA